MFLLAQMLFAQTKNLETKGISRSPFLKNLRSVSKVFLIMLEFDRKTGWSLFEDGSSSSFQRSTFPEIFEISLEPFYSLSVFKTAFSITEVGWVFNISIPGSPLP